MYGGSVKFKRFNNIEWKAHPKHPGYYFSRTGNCLGKHRTILKPRIKYNGYIQWVLNKKDVLAHRVIAEVFIPNPRMLSQINHKNGIKTDNNISNLEWATAFTNQQHSRDVLKKDYSHRRGENSNFVKLTEDKVRKIRAILKRDKKWGYGVRIAKQFNVSTATICMIKNGKVWGHLK